MNQYFHETILRFTGATELYEIELIQSLWSGYGKIVRIGLKGCERKSVVVKHVLLPDDTKHPRGWNTDKSHNRKVKSYKVETAFYKNWANLCTNKSYVPHCLALETHGEEVLMVLEDLDDTGYPVRKSSVTMTDMHACLSWLAHFHATFMGKTPDGLWKTGTYWHLETRPDELEVLEDKALKNAAEKIDQTLKQNKYQTLVHGDAKLANFCFSKKGSKVAAVDFQYTGGGCGMKDVAYFIGSCLYEEDCERYEQELLDYYFDALSAALTEYNKSDIANDIEDEWRPLYAVAWTDFHRFVKGWSPGHWKIHSYSEKISRNVLSKLSEY